MQSIECLTYTSINPRWSLDMQIHRALQGELRLKFSEQKSLSTVTLHQESAVALLVTSAAKISL